VYIINNHWPVPPNYMPGSQYGYPANEHGSVESPSMHWNSIESIQIKRLKDNETGIAIQSLEAAIQSFERKAMVNSKPAISWTNVYTFLNGFFYPQRRYLNITNLSAHEQGFVKQILSSLTDYLALTPQGAASATATAAVTTNGTNSNRAVAPAAQAPAMSSIQALPLSAFSSVRR
jgi:hypothetical protein